MGIKNVHTLIIGGGPSGIGAALKLGKEATILERAEDLGGFSRSINIKGAIFDYGGHSFHTPHPDVKELVYSSLEMYDQKRNAKCYFHGDVIDYPFQKNFNQLTHQNIVDACAQGIPKDVDKSEFDNFEDFIKEKFGKGISDHFMLPYNRKLWGRDLKRMAADWTAERVASLDRTERFKTSGGKRTPLQPDTKVGYPAKGGFGEIFLALGKKVENVDFNKTVVNVDIKKKLVTNADGSVYRYRNLISTIALPDFLELLNDCPIELKEITQSLDYLSMKLGLVVINHPIDTDIQRFYCAQDTISAHKIALNHNSSDYLRSLPKHGIMMEISEGPEKTLYRPDLKQWIADDLLKVGAIKSYDEIEHVEIRDVKYSYPVPTKTRKSEINQIKKWLVENDIHTLGRFGEWLYINSDKALKRGLDLGEELKKS